MSEEDALKKQVKQIVSKSIFDITSKTLPNIACSFCHMTVQNAIENEKIKGGSVFLDDICGYRSILCSNCTEFSQKVLFLMKDVIEIQPTYCHSFCESSFESSSESASESSSESFSKSSSKCSSHKVCIVSNDPGNIDEGKCHLREFHTLRIFSENDKYKRRFSHFYRLLSQKVTEKVSDLSIGFFESSKPYQFDREIASFLVRIVSNSIYGEELSDEEKCSQNREFYSFISISFFILNLCFEAGITKLPLYKTNSVSILLSAIFGIGIPDPSSECQYIEMNSKLSFASNYFLYKKNSRYLSKFVSYDRKFYLRTYSSKFCDYCYYPIKFLRKCHQCNVIFYCSQKCKSLHKHESVCKEISSLKKDLTE